MENMHTDVKMQRVEHNVPKILIAVKCWYQLTYMMRVIQRSYLDFTSLPR